MNFGDPDWRRVGGSRLEFSSTLEQFQEWLAAALPPEYAPYVIVGEDRIKPPGAQRYTSHLFCYPLEELKRCLNETPAHAAFSRAMVFIGSTRLTPELLKPATGDVERWLILTGLPMVDIGRPQPDGHRRVGDLVAVEKVVHVPTGRVVHHEEYSKIHRKLRRTIVSRLSAAKRKSRPPAAKKTAAKKSAARKAPARRKP